MAETWHELRDHLFSEAIQMKLLDERASESSFDLANALGEVGFDADPEGLALQGSFYLRESAVADYEDRDGLGTFEIASETLLADLETQLAHDVIEEALSLLDDQASELLALHLSRGVTAEQLADEMGMHTDEIIAALADAKLRLRDMLLTALLAPVL